MRPSTLTRTLAWIAVVAVAVALAAAHIQVQPSGLARALRSGMKLRILAGRVNVAPRYVGSSCFVSLRNSRLEFDDRLTVTGASGEEYGLKVSFAYTPPSRLSKDWPAGDWCASLQSRLASAATNWLRSTPAQTLIEKRRDAEAVGAVVLARDLESAGLAVDDLTVAVELAEGLARTQPISEVARLAVTAPPVIFLGLDGADWELLDGAMAAGKMPNLAAFVREGHGGVLETQHPPLSPLLWTTMMTGVDPLTHHILDFTRFHPASGVKEPITSDERAVPAIWNMATYAGKSVAVMGLWATYPAEPVRGTLVSDRLFSFLHQESEPPPGVVYPPRREAWARQALRGAEDQIDYAELKRYLPWLSETEYREAVAATDPYSQPISALRRVLVETRVYHELAMSALESERPDLAIFYFQGTDSIGHIFAPYAPPRQPQISVADYERYSGVPELYFEDVDRLLGDYKRMAAAAGAILLLASDHGFRWHEGRPTTLSSFAASTAAKWHRNEGIYLLWGQGIRPTPGHGGKGRVDQVCATLLALAGLPSGRGLAGPVLAGTPHGGNGSVDYARIFEASMAEPAVNSADSGRNAGKVAEEEIAKLRALGYIGAGESIQAAPGSLPAGSTRTAGWHNNEALILRDRKRPTEAIAAFENAIRIDPNLASALWNLSDMLFEEKRDLDRSDELLARALANRLPEGEKFAIGRAIGYQRSGEIARSTALMEKAVAAEPENAEFRIFLGRYKIEMKDCAGALEAFHVAQQLAPQNPITHFSAGLAAMCLGDRPEAVRNFERSLAINPNQPRIRAYLAELR